MTDKLKLPWVLKKIDTNADGWHHWSGTYEIYDSTGDMIDCNGACIASFELEHAELIVTAVNSHKELVEALEEALKIAREPEEYPSMQQREMAIINWKKQAEAALKKAKGE